MTFKKVTHVPVRLWTEKKWVITWVEDPEHPGEWCWRRELMENVVPEERRKAYERKKRRDAETGYFGPCGHIVK